MRQLGKGHSVMFFAPGEVDRCIRSLIPNHGPAFEDRIRAADVIRWAMHETCEDIRHHLPIWAQQGLDHHRRFAAYQDYSATGNLDVLRNAWLQRESRTLEEMYSLPAHADGIDPKINKIAPLKERMERFGITKLVDVRVAEEQEQEREQEQEQEQEQEREQEREVNHEIEQERHVERPQKVQPARHVLRRDIHKFVETGILPMRSAHIRPLLIPIHMAEGLELTPEWSPSPLATTDFTTTVLDSDGTRLTEYLRPVNWVLSTGSGRDTVVVAISPYEANELLPIIREKRKVRLHVYTPRVTLSMRSFSDLTFHSIPDLPAATWTAPAHIRTVLNLFSGQLYFDNREEYENLCALLALSRAHPGATYSRPDGFVPPAHRTGGYSPFADSKISILKTLIGLRRKGTSYSRTHLGQMLNAVPLSEETLSAM